MTMTMNARMYDGGWRDSFVLACGAAPATSTPLQLAQEFTQTKTAVREVTDVNSMWHTNRAFIHHDWSTVDSLKDDLIKYRPLVLHISSHAAEYEIFLAEDSAKSQSRSLKLKEFKNLVTILRKDTIPYPEVIVLNGCYTKAMAEELAGIRTATSPEHGPFVIGTTLDVHDEKAVNFTKEFYRSLARGSSLGEAFDLAQATSDDEGYFLHSGGRGTNDLEAANKYYVPPEDYMIIPFPTSYRRQRKRYELLLREACHPLTFATFQFNSQNSGQSVTAAGMEFKLDQLPLVGAEEISGFGTEADQLLKQTPRPSVPGANNNARYFVNHFRAITGEKHGACLLACYRGIVYYEDKGTWHKYDSARNFVVNGKADPVKWGEELIEWRDSFVLACGAAPATSTPLQLAQEFTQTKNAVQEVTDVHSMWHDTDRAFIHHDWSTVESLKDDLIKYRPLVLHISSHAAEYEIFLAEDSAKSQSRSLKLKEFKNLVTILRKDTIPYPEVIVLNGCYTKAMAEELAGIRTATSPEHGPFVIGTTLDVHDEKAVNFTKEFYRSLARGSSLGVAFNLAQSTSDDEGYFLHSGGRGTNDLEAANKYYVPPEDYMIFPIPTWYGQERKRYELLLREACHPLTFATFQFNGENSGQSVTAAGMEFKLDQLPLVGAEEISGFGVEADQLLKQTPRPSVPGANNDARYFVNHLRAITGEKHGACLLACYRGIVYYEDKGTWHKYDSARNFVVHRKTDPDPVKWREELPFEQ